MRDLWDYRWKFMGLYWASYAFMMFSFMYTQTILTTLLVMIPLMACLITFLVISSSHDGWISKRRERRYNNGIS